MTIDKQREAALKILYEINEKGAYSNIALSNYLDSEEIESFKRAFITELVYGVVKRKLTIDYIINLFSKVKIRKISPWIMNVLRLGVYQLFYMNKVPVSAACNESVKLSKKYGHKAAAGFVNAVLRNIARKKKEIKYPDRKEDITGYFSIKYSHPEWMVNYWMNFYGVEFTEKILRKNNSIPDLTIRVNTLKVSKNKVIDKLKKSGIKSEEGRYINESLILKDTISTKNPGLFKEGFLQVQDESSMIAVKILGPEQGEHILDLCSAPGGKTAYIAQLMKNSGIVTAMDIYEKKLRIVEDTMKNMGIKNVQTKILDAKHFDSEFSEKADRVLVDAPCSGLGIIRKKPDIKWNRKERDIKELSTLQYKILENAGRYVKPGGILLYSTCTISHEENSNVVNEYVKNSNNFCVEKIGDLLPAGLENSVTDDGFVQFFPHIHNIDGFFIAKLRKKL